MQQGLVMRSVFAAFIVVMLAAAPIRAAETVLADPKPSWDAPRKIVLQLTTDEPRHVGNVLHNAVNLQKFYGQDNVKVAIIAYAGGVRALLTGSTVAERIASLTDYEVEFVACGNTMDAIGKSPKDLLPGVEMVTAGIAEIVERQLRGWHTIVP